MRFSQLSYTTYSASFKDKRKLEVERGGEAYFTYEQQCIFLEYNNSLIGVHCIRHF